MTLDVAVEDRETIGRRRPARRAVRGVEPSTAVLVALLVVAAVVLLYAGRHLTFFYDEWNFILMRRGSGVGTYLDPHNGHLSLFPVVVYKILFATVGLRHYTAYRAVDVALHLLCAGLLYVLLRRRIGAWPALVPAALLLFLGTAWQDLLWPFQIGYLGSVAGGLGALTLLDSPRSRTLSDAAAAGCLIWSIASSGVGIAFLCACALLLIAQGSAWRRLWIIALPTVLFAAWYVGWGTSEPITSDAVLGAPQYVATAAGGATAAIAGLDSAAWGPPLAVAFVVAVCVALRSRGVGLTSMLLATVGGALVFWTLAAVARADVADPDASRYVYIGAVFLFLIAGEAQFGLGIRGGWMFAVGLVAAAAIVSNLNMLRTGESSLRASDTSVRTSLAAVQIAAPLVAPGFPPDPANAPQINAGPYLAAVRDLGSPAYTVPELERAPLTVQAEADSVLAQAEQLAVAPDRNLPTGDTPLNVDSLVGGRAITRGACDAFVPTASPMSFQVRLAPGGTLFIRASSGRPVSLYLRRFASSFPALAFATVRGGRGASLRLPHDLARQIPWSVQLVGSQATTVCAQST